jgi:hypothetical protein
MIRPGAAAPPPTLPLRFLAAAVVAFLLAALAVPWLASELAGHYYHPRLLALTHTVTLGWITLTIMGASYQLIPVTLGRPIWGERLARWQFGLLVAGIAGMLGHFFVGQWSGLAWAAALVVLGAGLHVTNVALSVRGLPAWTFTARLIVLALAGLTLTALFGLLLALDRVVKFLPGQFFPTLHAHFHLALLGWVLPMIIGVAARVYPMFLLAEEPAGRGAPVQFWGLALGVPAVVAGLLGLRSLLVLGALAVAAAAGAHLYWVFGMLRTRRRPRLDVGLWFVLTGAAWLGPSVALGLGFAFDLLGGPRLALAYAVLALGGWVSLTIAGMMLKIVPFLVWYWVYAPRAGRSPVPTLAQLSWPAGERAAYVLLATGIPALALAVAAGHPEWIRAAGLLLALGALALAAALGRVLAHARPALARARTGGLPLAAA